MENSVVHKTGFEDLPVEVIQDIYKYYLPDLTSIWALFKTSRRNQAIFEDLGLKAFESILDRSILARTRHFMHMVIGIRTKSLAMESWSQACTPEAHQSPPLTSAFTPLLMTKFVGLAFNIHVLSQACIKMFSERMEEASSDHARTFGPPTWLEEQRAMYSFWAIQYIYELKAAGLKGRLTWSKTDLKRLRDAYFYEIYFERGLSVRPGFTFLAERAPVTRARKLRQGSPLQSNVPLKELRLPNFKQEVFNWEYDTVEHNNMDVLIEPYAWNIHEQISRDPDAGLLYYGSGGFFRQLGVDLWEEATVVGWGLDCRWGLGWNNDRSDCYKSWIDLLTSDNIQQLERNRRFATHPAFVRGRLKRPDCFDGDSNYFARWDEGASFQCVDA